MGDGGAVVTDDDEIAARCRRLRDHGRLNKDLHAEVGFNLRFNDIQASIGRVLLRRLDAMNARRRALAARYDAALAGLPLALPRERPGACHVYHLYVVRTPRRTELAAFLKARGIQTGIHYPVATHRQPAVERFAGAAAARDRAARERDPDLADLRRPHRGRDRRGGGGGQRVLRSLMAGPPLRVLEIYPKGDFFTGRGDPAARACPRPGRPRPPGHRGHTTRARRGLPAAGRPASPTRPSPCAAPTTRARPGGCARLIRAAAYPGRPRPQGPRAHAHAAGRPDGRPARCSSSTAGSASGSAACTASAIRAAGCTRSSPSAARSRTSWWRPACPPARSR